MVSISVVYALSFPLLLSRYISIRQASPDLNDTRNCLSSAPMLSLSSSNPLDSYCKKQGSSMFSASPYVLSSISKRETIR